MPHLHRSLLALAAAALLLAVTADPALAVRPHDARGASFVPVAGQLDGRTGPQLLADSFVPDYEQTASQPADDCLRLGKHGRVLWLNAPATCALRQGEPVVALPGASCSDVEDPPFFAVGRVAQRVCARELNTAILSIGLAVDGNDPVEIIRPTFAVSPPQRRVVIPADSALGLPAGPATFTADGWAAVLRHLEPGTHTVSAAVTFADADAPVVFDYTLIVSGRG